MMRGKKLLQFRFLPVTLSLCAALAITLLVNGCAPKRVQPPASEVPPAQQSAAAGLIKEGRQLLASGAVDQAGATLERAIRIAPRDPAAWYGLARVRFAQHRYGQTIELCRKALTLPTTDPLLRHQCNELMATAKTKQQ